MEVTSWFDEVNRDWSLKDIEAHQVGLNVHSYLRIDAEARNRRRTGEVHFLWPQSPGANFAQLQTRSSQFNR